MLTIAVKAECKDTHETQSPVKKWEWNPISIHFGGPLPKQPRQGPKGWTMGYAMCTGHLCSLQQLKAIKESSVGMEREGDLSLKRTLKKTVSS